MRIHWRLYRKAERAKGPATAAALLCAYITLSALVGLFCRDQFNNAAFWPANGVLVAGLLTLRPRTGQVFLAIAFAVTLAQNFLGGVGLAESLLYTSLNISLSVGVALLARTFCGAAIDLARVNRLVVFCTAALFATLVEATVGQTVLTLIAPQSPPALLDWLQWVGEDWLGLIIGTPAVLLVLQSRRMNLVLNLKSKEGWLLAALTVAMAVIAFSLDRFPLFLLLYPLLLLAAFRGGPASAAVSVLLTALIAAVMTDHGRGPIILWSAGSPMATQYMIKLFIASIFLCAAPPTNALAERNRTAVRLLRLTFAAREARQSAEAANAAKSQFLANMSHEIRTPLNGVLGMAAAMQNDELPSRQRERLSVIRSSGDLLLALLNDVLDMSKIEAGKLELEAIPFDVAELAHETIAAFNGQAEQKGLSLSASLVDPKGAPLTHGVYLGDPVRVRQILYNLLSNGVKFTQDGAVSLVVTACPNRLIIEVHDSGCGISEAVKRTLFRKFEQADASTARQFGGSGLGLAITQELAVLMGGSISVESEAGQGALFRVDLPLKSHVPELARQDPAQSDPHLVESQTLRILAAEDHATNRLVLQTLLQQLGLEAVMVEDGAAAVDAWKSGEWDAILMDIQMPVMDGCVAASLVREQEKAQGRPRTPIIALTANVMEAQRRLYAEIGFDRVVAKPIVMADLAAALFDCLAHDERGAASHRDLKSA